MLTHTFIWSSLYDYSIYLSAVWINYPNKAGPSDRVVRQMIDGQMRSVNPKSHATKLRHSWNEKLNYMVMCGFDVHMWSSCVLHVWDELFVLAPMQSHHDGKIWIIIEPPWFGSSRRWWWDRPKHDVGEMIAVLGWRRGRYDMKALSSTRG